MEYKIIQVIKVKLKTWLTRVVREFHDGNSLVIESFLCWRTRHKYFKKFGIQNYLGFQNINYGDLKTPWDTYRTKQILKQMPFEDDNFQQKN